MVVDGAPMVKYSALMGNYCAPTVKKFISYFLLHQVHSTDEEGNIYMHLRPQAVDSIKLVQGYRFDSESQEIYLSRDLLEFIPRHQWPDVQLPFPQAVPPPQPPEPSVN